jgi:hypothetical protein
LSIGHKNDGICQHLQIPLRDSATLLDQPELFRDIRIASQRIAVSDVFQFKQLAKFVSRWDSLAELPTYPTFKPRIQFDHIVARGLSEETIKRAQESAEVLQLPISDHCALVVEVKK